LEISTIGKEHADFLDNIREFSKTTLTDEEIEMKVQYAREVSISICTQAKAFLLDHLVLSTNKAFYLMGFKTLRRIRSGLWYNSFISRSLN